MSAEDDYPNLAAGLDHESAWNEINWLRDQAAEWRTAATRLQGRLLAAMKERRLEDNEALGTYRDLTERYPS